VKTKSFSEAFFGQLSDDTLIALTSVCQEFRRLDQQANQRAEYLEDYLEALAAFTALAASSDFQMKPKTPAAASTSQDNIREIRAFFNQNEAELTRLLNTVYLERQTKKYADFFQSGAAYVFSDLDFERVQELINEMRGIITASQVISPKHKQRLLERLERMQRELHKTTSDLDRFWGFIGEAGIVLGQFGKDVAPLVDHIKELADIVWKTIRIKERLLNNMPPISLPDPDDKTSDA
jgi:hypothetical protein